MMGSEKMGHWFVGKNHVDRETINDRIPFKISISTFHHSIIPYLRQ
jgi:hypothetical protein